MENVVDLPEGMVTGLKKGSKDEVGWFGTSQQAKPANKFPGASDRRTLKSYEGAVITVSDVLIVRITSSLTLNSLATAWLLSERPLTKSYRL